MKTYNMKKTIEVIEAAFNYKFKNKNLIENALTHKSFCIGEYKNKIHNERLEFLGDAVLGLVVAENLMIQSPNDNEGSLSKKRASLVNQDVLADKAKNLNLQLFLILGPGEKEQESHLKPRLLASAYEALIGAFYLDAEFDLVKKYLLLEFNIDIEKIKPDLEYEKDYKTRLQELTQKMNLGVPSYKLISTTGPSHKPEFQVELSVKGRDVIWARGHSKKYAEQVAAELQIKELIKNNLKNNEDIKKVKKNDNTTNKKKL